MKDLFLYAWGNITHKKLRSWLTLIGVLIGITAVVALIGLGDGLKSAVTSTFGFLNPDELSLQAQGIGQGPPGQGASNPLKKSYTTDINKLRTVEISYGQMIETVKLEFNDVFTIGFTQSIPSGIERKYLEESNRLEVVDGRLLRDEDRYSVVVGYDYSGENNEFGKALSVRDKILIDEIEFRVIGILEKKGSFILDGSILMNEDVLRDLKNNKDEYDVIEVKARARELVSQAKTDIERYLRSERNVKEGDEDFSVSTAETALSSINSILSGVQGFIFVVAFISIFVGAVGIANTMFTSVVERKKEIGIMKAIGARNLDIFAIFVFESGLMGLIGGILGVIFGVALSQLGNIGISSFLGTNYVFIINFGLIFGALLGSFIIGAVSGVVPALNAARMKPVDAIRQ